VKDRRPITEDDILLTEMLIARSYGNLKQSVVRASSETLSSIGGSVGGTAGAAAGAGIILFGLFKLMSRGSPSRGRAERGRKHSSDMGMDIISLITPLLMPYITAYLEKYLGQMFSKNRDRNA
jgi:hypothetical protein